MTWPTVVANAVLIASVVAFVIVPVLYDLVRREPRCQGCSNCLLWREEE